MIGLILCSGRGTRLKEETRYKPKCMVDVGGKPILEHVADHMNKNGIWRIVVNLHSFPEVVMKYFGQRFLYLYEPVPMGEMQTIALVREMFGYQDLMVMNGDTLTDLDLKKAVGRCLTNGTYMGTTFIPETGIIKMAEVKCWWQDAGTPEGLVTARKHYEHR